MTYKSIQEDLDEIYEGIQEDLDEIKEMLDTLYGTKNEEIDINDDANPDLDDWIKYN